MNSVNYFNHNVPSTGIIETEIENGEDFTDQTTEVFL